MPSLSAINRDELASDKARLIALCKDVARTREEHRRYAMEVAQLAVKWKSRLQHGEYQEFFRSCGFNLKTLEGWVLKYRRSIGEAAPRQSANRSAAQMDEVHPFATPKSAGSVATVDAERGDVGSAFDPAAAADAEDDAAWNASAFDDEVDADTEDELFEGEGGDDADNPVSGGATPDPQRETVRPLGARGGAPRGGGVDGRAEQLTLDDVYAAAEREARELLDQIHRRDLTGDQVAAFRRFVSTLRSEGRAG